VSKESAFFLLLLQKKNITPIMAIRATEPRTPLTTGMTFGRLLEADIRVASVVSAGDVCVLVGIDTTVEDSSDFVLSLSIPDGDTVENCRLSLWTTAIWVFDELMIALRAGTADSLVSEIASGVGALVTDAEVLKAVGVEGTSGVLMTGGTISVVDEGTGITALGAELSISAIEVWIGSAVVWTTAAEEGASEGAWTFALGTAVHRFPLMVVILNPACRGRFWFVDMVGWKKSNTSCYR
jgi:hypothetical protein